MFVISKKIVFWELVFWSKNSISIWCFSQVIFFDQNTLFSTLEPYLAILSIGSLFLWENLFVVEIDHQVLYPSFICDIPLVRGDCGYPSSERLIVEVVLVSLLAKR